MDLRKSGIIPDMADWTNPPDVRNNTLADAVQMQVAYNNTIAAMEGAVGAPRLNINALRSVEINKNGITPHPDQDRFIVDLSENFTHDQLPVYAIIERLEQDEQDIRERFPTGRIVPVSYFDSPFVTGNVQYEVGSHLDMHIFNRAPSLPNRDPISMGAVVWYQNRNI